MVRITLKTTHDHKKQVLFLFFRILLGATFIIAGYGKILDPAGFADIIANYNILPDNLVNITALILPWIEMCAGLALVFGWYVKGAALLVNAMMVVFIGLFAYNQYRGLDISCGCFSLSPKKPDNLLLDMTRDMFILATGLWVMRFQFHVKEKAR